LLSKFSCFSYKVLENIDFHVFEGFSYVSHTRLRGRSSFLVLGLIKIMFPLTDPRSGQDLLRKNSDGSRLSYVQLDFQQLFSATRDSLCIPSPTVKFGIELIEFVMKNLTWSQDMVFKVLLADFALLVATILMLLLGRIGFWHTLLRMSIRLCCLEQKLQFSEEVHKKDSEGWRTCWAEFCLTVSL